MRQGPLFFSLILSLFLFSSKGQAEEALQQWSKKDWSIHELLALLDTIPTGALAIQKAEKKDPNFRLHLNIGTSSITENTYTRSYSLLDGKEEVSVDETIYLSRSLSSSDAVVDLAHELTHFADKKFMSPYTMNLSRDEFIRTSIEGEGGELAAFSVECHVAWELQKKYKDFPEHALCSKYQEKDGSFAFAKARVDYYAVGVEYPHAMRLGLTKSFPDLSLNHVIFTSSYAHQSYPLALANEYEETRHTACANNAKKYHLIAAAQGGQGRAPASLQKEVSKLLDYQKNYCESDSNIAPH